MICSCGSSVSIRSGGAWVSACGARSTRRTRAEGVFGPEALQERDALIERIRVRLEAEGRDRAGRRVLRRGVRSVRRERV